MSKRDISVLLADMLEAIENIQQYSKGLTFESFTQDRLRTDAIVRNFEILSEAANRVPKEYQDLHAEIEWAQIIGLRHRIIHGYFDVKLNVVWETIQRDLSPLKEKLEKLSLAR